MIGATWSVDRSDQHRHLLILAVAGAGVATVLAVVGLPPVDLHNPLHRAGIMDPGCGGTRALRLAARGDILGALSWNPASPVLLIGALGYIVRTIVGAATGRWLNARATWQPRTYMILGCVAMVALEVRQQGIASRLMRLGY